MILTRSLTTKHEKFLKTSREKMDIFDMAYDRDTRIKAIIGMLDYMYKNCNLLLYYQYYDTKTHKIVDYKKYINDIDIKTKEFVRDSDDKDLRQIIDKLRNALHLPEIDSEMESKIKSEIVTTEIDSDEEEEYPYYEDYYNDYNLSNENNIVIGRKYYITEVEPINYVSTITFN